MRTVAIEEHFISEALRSLLDGGGEIGFPVTKLRDLGAGRIAAMDASRIDLQVISSTVVTSQAAVTISMARETNDELAAAIAIHPDRYAGFATLPMAYPEAAADELERAVRSLGFVGALINGNVAGHFLDEPQFFPVLERACSLDVPLYIHPGLPPDAVRHAYYSPAHLGGPVNSALAKGAWGWHSEAGLHALRLILSGVYDRLPNLRTIIGHMGEMIPFMFERIAYSLQSRHSPPGRLDRTIKEYLTQNFYVTTSGFFWKTPFAAAMDVFGIDRLIFSVDYPYNSNAEGREFLDSLALGESDFEKLSHGNAERALRIGSSAPQAR